jgi:pimeloyl-ACP methyl ester carboxylesterase
LLNRRWVQGKIDAWLVAVIKKAKENKGDPAETPTQGKLDEIRDQTVGPFLDHFEQGAAGFVQETQILVRPWGFPFEDVKARVQIYHGAKDANAPPQMMRILAERLPNCDMQELEKDDHYTMGSYMADAMSKLVSENEDKRV